MDELVAFRGSKLFPRAGRVLPMSSARGCVEYSFPTPRGVSPVSRASYMERETGPVRSPCMPQWKAPAVTGATACVLPRCHPRQSRDSNGFYFREDVEELVLAP